MKKTSTWKYQLATRPVPQRSAWRQRIVEVERGVTAGFRANSAFFFYFFTTSVLISVSLVIGLSGLQWAILTLSVVTAISSELFYFSLQKIGQLLKSQFSDEIQQLLAMATAACMLLLLGSISTILIVLVTRFMQLYG